MIGTALIEECVKQNVEVYAVIRSSSGKQSRLPDSSLIHLIDCSLETLDHLPELIPAGCDTFYHIAWGNTGENRNRSTELQSRNISYTLDAVRAANALGCKRFIGAGSQTRFHRTVRQILRHLMERASWHPVIWRGCSARSLAWNVSGRGFSVFTEFMRKKQR